MRMIRLGISTTVVCFLLFAGIAKSAPAVNVATAPDARSVAIGSAATIFVEFVNSGTDAALNCSIAKPAGVPIDLAYQTLDAGGALSGTPDTPVNVGAGASQRFLVTFTPTAAFEGRVHLRYRCDNFTPFVFEDVNDLFLTASAGAPPDLIAIFATPSGDGVMRVATAGGAQAAGGAVVNIGSGGGSATVDVTPTFGAFDTGLGITLSICETDPVTGACMVAPAPTIQMSVGAAAKTFSVFASTNAGFGAPLFPEYIRVSVVFSDPAAAPDAPEGGNPASGIKAINGSIRGRGSVAFTSPAANISNPDISIFAGEYKLRMRDLSNDPNSDFISTGTLNIGSNGVATGIYHRFSVVDGSGNFVGEADQVFRLEGTFDVANLTFAGEMIFVPDVFLNTPPLRGNFVANFDPGRSVRGTYSFKSAADLPVKQQAGGISKPQTIPTSSLNIQATGMHWLAIQNCAIVRNIASSKVFDVYLDGVKIGTTTFTRNSNSPSDFTFAGSITAAEGNFDISGRLETPTQDTNPFSAIDGARELIANTLRITESAGEQNTVLSDEFNFKQLGTTSGTLVSNCTTTGFTIEFFQNGNPGATPAIPERSLVLEFRMP